MDNAFVNNTGCHTFLLVLLFLFLVVFFFLELFIILTTIDSYSFFVDWIRGAVKEMESSIFWQSYLQMNFANGAVFLFFFPR
jgi:hypothetical protein